VEEAVVERPLAAHPEEAEVEVGKPSAAHPEEAEVEVETPLAARPVAAVVVVERPSAARPGGAVVETPSADHPEEEVVVVVVVPERPSAFRLILAGPVRPLTTSASVRRQPDGEPQDRLRGAFAGPLS
jgi:hypothetical protein